MQNCLHLAPALTARPPARHIGDAHVTAHRRCVQQVVCAAPIEEADVLRAAPLAAGALGITAVLLNRIISGLEPTLMASSSQSRVDVIAITMSAVLTLTGLQWLSLKPKVPATVELEGQEVQFIEGGLSKEAAAELTSAWNSIRWATPAKMMAVFQNGRCIMHVGYMARGHTPGSARPGPISNAVQTNEKSNYLANLTLFPGRGEFHQYFPENTQSVILQPCGSNGSIVIGAATQRGFTVLDQAWISAWVDKVVAALEEEPQAKSAPL